MSRTTLAIGIAALVVIAVGSLFWLTAQPAQPAVATQAARPQSGRIAAPLTVPAPRAATMWPVPSGPARDVSTSQAGGPKPAQTSINSAADLTFTVDYQQMSFEQLRRQLLQETGLTVMIDPKDQPTAPLTLQMKDATMAAIFTDITRQTGVPWMPMLGGAIFTRNPPKGPTPPR